MQKFRDDSLGDPATLTRKEAASGQSVEVGSVVGDPEDFDFDAWVGGARGASRAVRITNRGDLLREVDLILHRANDPDINEGEAEKLLARIDELKREIWNSQRVFIVQGRSASRRAKARAAAGKEPDKKAPVERHVRFAQYSMLCELADAITSPQGVTPDALHNLYEECPGEVDKLWGAFTEACEGKGAPIVNFSQRR